MIHSVSEKGGSLRLPDLPMLSGLRWFRRKTLTGGAQGQARFQVRLLGVIHRGDLGAILSVVERAKEQFLQSPSRFHAKESFRLFENLINIVKIRERQVITAAKDVPEGRRDRELSEARLRLDKARGDLREIVCWVARNELRDNGRKHAEFVVRALARPKGVEAPTTNNGIGVGEKKRLFEEVGRRVRAKFMAFYPELDPSCLKEIEQVVKEARPELEKWLSVGRSPTDEAHGVGKSDRAYRADRIGDVDREVLQVVLGTGNCSGKCRAYRSIQPRLGQILDVWI